MNAQSQENFEKLDAVLNKSYKDLLGRNDEDPSFAGVLKEAQRAWLKYVELHMTSVFPLAEGENPQEVYGSIYPLEYNNEKTKLYKQRIELLNAMTVENDNTESDSETPELKPQINAAQLTPDGPNSPGLKPQIKGLGIGMGFSRLVPWFDEKLKDTTLGYEIFPNTQTNVFMIALADRLEYLQKDEKKQISASDREYQLKNLRNGLQDVPSYIMADDKGSVFHIVLQPPLVNYLFKSKDIALPEFVKLFTDAYNLKDLPIIEDKFDSFSCTTADGIKITIESDKTVTMKKVEEPAKVKGAFD